MVPPGTSTSCPGVVVEVDGVRTVGLEEQAVSTRATDATAIATVADPRSLRHLVTIF
jgi:hypothetical protein